MKKILLLLVALMICWSVSADWSHGTACFKGNQPQRCMLVGVVTIWYNGTLTCVGSSGTTRIYRGTGDICVAFPKNYNGDKFKFETPGTVQIQYYDAF